MKLKSIRLLLKNSLLVALAAVIIAGATGLSYKAHYCHNHLSGIAFYSELGIQKPVSCGCKEDANYRKPNPVSEYPFSLNQSGCCENVSFYNKLHVESQVDNFSSLVPIQFSNCIYTEDFNILAATKENAVIFSVNEFRPPPLISGRKLVVFLSQLRIPLIS